MIHLYNEDEIQKLLKESELDIYAKQMYEFNLRRLFQCTNEDCSLKSYIHCLFFNHFKSLQYL